MVMTSSVKKSILLNSSYLLLSDVGARLLSALATIFLARYLGPEAFGLYIVAFSLAYIFGFLTDMGLIHTYIRESTRESGDSAALLGSFLKVKLALAVVSSILGWLVITFLYNDEPLRMIAYTIVLPSIWGAALTTFSVAYFTAIQKMKYVAIIKSTMSLSHAAFLTLGIYLNASLRTLSFSPGLSSLVAGSVGLIFVLRRNTSFRGWHASELFSGSLMFAALGLISIALPQIGPLVLEKVTTVHEVGIFAAMYRIPLLLAIVPVAITSAYYPQQFKYAHYDQKSHLSLSLKGFRIIPVLAVGLALPFTLYGEWVVAIVLGEGWAESSCLLSILAWLVVIQGASRPLANYLITLGEQTRLVAVLSAAMITGFLLYVFLGGKYGALGGVWAAVIVEIVILAGYLICCSRTGEFVKQGVFVSARILLCLIAPLLIKLVVPHELRAVGAVMAPISFYLALICLYREFRQDVKWVINMKNWAT